MRILILDTYYPEALRRIYESHPGLESQTYADQSRAVYDFGFARADFLPLNLNKLGHEAQQFIVNAGHLQRRWAQENGLRLPENGVLPNAVKLWKRGYAGIKRRVGVLAAGPALEFETKVVAAQVQAFRPDVIFVCDVVYLPREFLLQLKKNTRLLVGEMAYPIPKGTDLGAFDLLLSAAPHFVERIRAAGIDSELFRLGFESSILPRLGRQEKTAGAVFIGSVSAHHQERKQLLEEVSRRVPLLCWGAGAESLPPDSSLRGKVQPPLWGYAMYQQLQQAKIALNIHIDLAEKYAANMRLYEATGVGTMLVTDAKINLHELFEPGKEVVAYRSPEECAELIAHYLDHPVEREAIASAGQQRTLREHTYYHRMQELIEIIGRRI
ncbi:MAG: hypothetical protein QOH42_2415 [Blastocatellia bacterium]|jgi:hypothetical protein|nr:hypothetical protein [Blastocatellia bacterium]